MPTRAPLRITILTIFPDIFGSYLKESLLGKAQKNKLLDVRIVNIRDYTKKPHNQVDDRAFGGGPGMVLKVDPIYDAVKAIKKKEKRGKTRVILFSTRGAVFTQPVATRFSRYNHLIFICGRYEGVDERVAEHIADEEVSIGDFVLSGGELPALIVMEAVIRLREGFMHTHSSLEDIKGSYPVYSRPESFKRPGMKKAWNVPDVLLSGNHKNIAAWRARYHKKHP